MKEKLTYVTIVNESYLPILEKLIDSYLLFSDIKLTVFTINFDYNRDINNIEFIKYVDENILEYEKNSLNKFIKTDKDKYKYTTLLKPTILSKFLNKYDYYFFVDCDILFTKNSDTLFLNSIYEFGDTEIPVSTKFFHQFCNHGNNERIFNEDGSFNQKSLTFLPICEIYNTEPNIIDYVSTYCMFYTKKCLSFFEEVIDICFNSVVTSNYDYYLPLGDETIFNYLYSKYSFSKYMSSFLCYDVAPWLDINIATKNLEKGGDFISFIHTKRFNKIDNQNFVLKDDEYEKIFNTITKNYKKESNINITSINKDTECVYFTVNYEKTNKVYYIKIISLFTPNFETLYALNLEKDVNYFVGLYTKKIVKDLCMVIYEDKIIKDVIKI